jgi:hypothetical protein
MEPGPTVEKTMCTLQEHTQRWADEKKIEGPAFVVEQVKPGVARVKVQPAGLVEEMAATLQSMIGWAEDTYADDEQEPAWVYDAYRLIAKARGEG